MPFNAYTVPANTVRTTRVDMDENDTLAVASGGVLNVSANAQAVRFNAPTSGAVITNDGLIADTAAGGRAIRFESSVGPTLTATINNGIGDPTAEIRGVDDAIQIQARDFTGGTLTINNAGLIQSSTNQALDFGGATGALSIAITNNAGGRILGNVSEAIRIGTMGSTVVNSGTITGGSDAGYSTSVDGIQFEDNTSGSVTNNNGGAISGDRHGIDAGVGSTISVVNNLGGTITGRNGSGVGSDGSGSVTNYGTITGAVTNDVATDANSPGNPGVADGIPDGDGDGVDMDGTLNLLNFGRIEGLGASGVGGDGLPNTSDGVAAGGGSIDNRAGGVIISTDRGILIDNGSQGNSFALTAITNAGRIEGTTGIGIRLVSTFNDTIQNAGTITGGNGTAILFGEGNNVLKLLATSIINGVTDGEGGIDTLDYSDWGPAGVTVDLAAGTASGTGGVSHFEGVVGGVGNDRLGGSTGDNTLSAGGGNDLINGHGGQDSIDGGDGSDTAVFDVLRADATLTFDGNGGAVVKFGGSTTLTTNVEHFQFSDITVDRDTTSPPTDNPPVSPIEDHSLVGSAGGEIINAGNGNDQVHAGGGDDTVFGELGSDGLYGDDGNDFLGAGAGNDLASGGDGNDEVHGEDGDDLLWGNRGDDGVYGEAGNDQVRGGEGNDRVFGGVGDDGLYGEEGNDFLGGGSGNDLLSGGAGDDSLVGEEGNDELWGNAGRDVFVFFGQFGQDRIKDLDEGGERDLVAFGRDVFSSYAEVMSHAQQVGGDVVITAGANTVTIEHTAMAALTQDHFYFV